MCETKEESNKFVDILYDYGLTKEKLYCLWFPEFPYYMSFLNDMYTCRSLKYINETPGYDKKPVYKFSELEFD